MILIKRIVVSKFLSYDRETVFDYGVGTTNLILGVNGAGKTSLLVESFIWALTGKTIKPLKTADVANRTAKGKKKDTKVTVYLDIDGQGYAITRTLEPSLEVIHNEKSILTGSSVKENEEQISKILKCPVDNFVNFITMSLGNSFKFLGITPLARIKIVNEYLGIEQVEQSLTQINEETKQATVKCKQLDGLVNQFRQEVENKQSELETLRGSNSSKEIKELTVNQNELQKQLSQCVSKEDIDREVVGYEQKKTVIQQEIDKYNKIVGEQQGIKQFCESQLQAKINIVRPFMSDIKVLMDKGIPTQQAIDTQTDSIVKQKEHLEQQSKNSITFEQMSQQIAAVEQDVNTRIQSSEQELSVQLGNYSNLEVVIRGEIDSFNETGKTVMSQVKEQKLLETNYNTILTQSNCPYCGNTAVAENVRENIQNNILPEIQSKVQQFMTQYDGLTVEINKRRNELQKLSEIVAKLRQDNSVFVTQLRTAAAAEVTELRQRYAETEQINRQITDITQLCALSQVIKQKVNAELQITQTQQIIDNLRIQVGQIDNEINQTRAKYHISENLQNQIYRIGERLRELEGDVRKIATQEEIVLQSKNNLAKYEEEKRLQDYEEYVCKTAYLIVKNAKNRMLDVVIPSLETTINMYLTEFDSDFVVRILSGFELQIQQEGMDVAVGGFSQGEEILVEIAINLALYEVLSSFISCESNIIVLDEILDKGLDETNFKNVVAKLVDFAKTHDKSINIISHRGYGLPDCNRFLVEKINRVSDIRVA